MTIQQCRYVLEIARRGSMSEAASALYTAQATVSVAVRELEEELGVRLFDRTNRGALVTRDGAEFIRYAKQLVSQADVVDLRYKSEAQRSMLAVSAQHYDFAADAFAEFVRLNAGRPCRISMKETRTLDIIEDVRSLESELGIVVVAKRDSFMPRFFAANGLRFTPLFDSRTRVCVRAGHPLACCAEVTREQAAAYPYIEFEQGDGRATQFSEELIEGFEPPRRIFVNDRATLVELLLSTDSCTTGTGIMSSEVYAGRVLSIPIKDADEYTVGWICRESMALSEKAAEFLEILRSRIPERE